MPILKNYFVSILKAKIYYEDTDAGGVVYYANYLKFIERGRSEFLAELGIDQYRLAKDEKIIFAVKSLSADFLAPARLGEQIFIHSTIEKVGFATVIFAQKITRTKRDTVLFTARVVIACLQSLTFKPRAIPDDILESINGE